MDSRRTLPLILWVGLAMLVTLGRLAWIQLAEHEVWVEQAARLMHTGAVLPYRRGTIRDGAGRNLVEDREAYHLVLSYREFRREHPLGQVAHARTALEMRPVSLAEAHANLERWAHDLVRLTPTQVRAFGRGAALELPDLSLPAAEEPGAVHRGSRASDLHFYIAGLLDPEERYRRELIKARRSKNPQPSYLELVARQHDDLQGSEELWQLVAERLTASVGALEVLGRELGLPERELERDEPRSAGALELIVAELEARRRKVEDDAAGKLFASVTGFAVGRVEPILLERHVDLSWLRRLLRWDGARQAEWLRDTRAGWLAWRDGFALSYLLADLGQVPADRRDPDQVLSLVAAIHQEPAAFEAALDGRPIDWREVSRLSVFSRLGQLFAAAPPRGFDPGAAVPLFVQDPQVRALKAELPGRWGLLTLGADWTGGPLPELTAAPYGPADRARHGPRLDWIRERARECLGAWEARIQAELADALDLLHLGAAPGDLSAEGLLEIDEAWLDEVHARSRYLLIDYGNRRVEIEDRPSDEVVYLLTRYAELYPGFEAVDARERVPVVLAGEEGLPALHLIGGVLGADPEDMRRQRHEVERLAELRRKPWRSPDEEIELERLVGAVRLAEEYRGVSGVEGHWDELLRGLNGFREHLGLEEIDGRSGGYTRLREPLDGRDLTLTLRADVQLAVERLLEFPALPDDPLRDDVWYRYPVGAIVLATVEGDVIAAASAPPPWAAIEEGAPAARTPFERTLRKPDFQPPGSVFKPFVAAWALGHEPQAVEAAVAPCEWIDEGGAGYKGVHCWHTGGHGLVDLHDALLGSCNAYFAQLGEGLSTADFWNLSRSFGFGEPTGIAQLRGAGGFKEESSPELFGSPLQGLRERLRAANGLSVVEATPMQLARAYAGLATGRLPAMRLVQAVDGVPLEREPATPVPIPQAVLDEIRRALVDVANQQGGTAYSALRRDELGYHVAAKTGSADLTGGIGDQGVRKHTWTAGWLPAEDPRVVFVVFVHDTSATSSHGAVHLVSDLFADETVRAWLESVGVGP